MARDWFLRHPSADVLGKINRKGEKKEPIKNNSPPTHRARLVITGDGPNGRYMYIRAAVRVQRPGIPVCASGDHRENHK